MRIALFSDVHANLPALEVFFNDLDKRAVDAVYCLGDLVGYNVWPDEVVAEIRKRKIPTIAGNHDLKVKRLRQDQDADSIDYAYHLGSDEARSFLLGLPRFIRLEFELNEKPLKILLVHGSPRSVSEYMLEDLDEHYLLELFDEAACDVICCGHTHKPYHRTINTSEGCRQIINIGALGKPKDGDPRGCYVILTIDSQFEKSGLDVEFVRFEYNVERAAEGVLNSPLPAEFADRLRKAY